MADEKPPNSVPWFLNSSIMLAVGGGVVGGIGGILETLNRLGLIRWKFVAADWTPGVVGVYLIAAFAVWIYRRVRLGNDPTNTLPKITSGLPPTTAP